MENLKKNKNQLTTKNALFKILLLFLKILVLKS